MSGMVVWFTGLPSSGKSQLAQRVLSELNAATRPCCLLDGDRVRELLRPKPGYSPAERDNFYATLALLAAELANQGLIVLVAATALRRAYRERARAAAPRFVEVWLNASTEECRSRDAKRLYASFARGQVSNLPGADAEYEVPETPEVSAFGAKDDAAVSKILEHIGVSTGTNQTNES
ncbi:MAG TPA: adenylyl-sulfate kinase [Polyangiaceae bacterium]|jgi:adenylylsulfate kinase|nr:adenylyl-sulfate kinase [Polyangiaceae bacterium]